MMTDTILRRLRMSTATAMVSVFPVFAMAQTATPDATSAASPSQPDVLHVESNFTTAVQNSILSYDIAADGSLRPTPSSPYLTGGTGFFDSSYALGPFDNDQNIILNSDKTVLYAINGGSNTIAVMHVAKDGSLSPFSSSPVAAHGEAAVSFGLHGNTLVTADHAIKPAVTDSNISPRLTTSPIPRSTGIRVPIRVKS